MLVAKNYLPFMGIEYDSTRTITHKGRDRTFRVFTYQAYNAMGLIGSECNGVAICDEDNKSVVTDGLGASDSGYCGVSQSTARLWKYLLTCPKKDFIETINSSDRLRQADWLEA